VQELFALHHEGKVLDLERSGEGVIAAQPFFLVNVQLQVVIVLIIPYVEQVLQISWIPTRLLCLGIGSVPQTLSAMAKGWQSSTGIASGGRYCW
jgi:hypothetical protein